MSTLSEGSSGPIGWILSKEPIAIGIFLAYFGLIAGFSYLVYKSITANVKVEDIFSGRPFLFLRLAIASLGCTWYFMIEYMRWSFRNYASTHPAATFGTWLLDTALFEEAWSIVCRGTGSWWWSSWICIWSVLFTAIIYRESPRRGIKYPWAYLVLGMLVAISFSTGLYLAASYLHPRKSGRAGKQSDSGLLLLSCLGLSLLTIWRIPAVSGTPQFLSTLLWMHVFLLLPFIPVPSFISGTTIFPQVGTEDKDKVDRQSFRLNDQTVYSSILMPAFLIALTNTVTLSKSMLSATPNAPTSGYRYLFNQAFSHPAQGSISMDVIWSAITLGIWYLVSGSFLSTVLKSLVIAGYGSYALAKHYGINWRVVLSAIPILGLLSFGVGYLALARARSKNVERRKEMMENMGIKENVVLPGTKDRAPSKAGRKLVVGFWHPYCNAGGGGERVLWSAIAYIQRKQPETVCLIYSGDYPIASKEQILGKAMDRFSININPKLVRFIPLHSRYLISDSYWSRFTLLGQSFGSIWLAVQGLCGSDGLWGDIFIDTMGHAFTYPFVRLLAGSEIVIATYTHYPTVSADMVRRVKTGEKGVESGTSQTSWIKSKLKLIYYSIFTNLYATSLLFAENIMTNSTWTQNHIQTLLSSAKQSLSAGILLMDETTERKAAGRGEKVQKKECKVVYPPCDVKSLVGCGLNNRGRGLVSLAQFRPEKDHARQLYSLAELFKQYPDYRTGEERVTLTLMGGVRDEGDQGRLDALNTLAKDLGIEENVEFVVNAPYSEIIKRLGEASIGLNTMQDEHFGINVVEFMAAGLIPIVHASAGPKMDIVVDHKGKQTGYHATSPTEFSQAIHTALSLPEKEQKRMREAARSAAKDRFSQDQFEKGWEGVWVQIIHRVKERVTD